MNSEIIYEKEDRYKVNIELYLWKFLRQHKNSELIQKELNKYLNIISALPLKFKRYGNSKSQNFEMDIYYDLEKRYGYQLMWNIDSALYIIERDNIRPSQTLFSFYKNYYHDDNLTESKLKNTIRDETPIIFVDFPMVDKRKILIDGNHRLHHAFQAGRPYMMSYNLNIDQSLESMQNEGFRTLYKIHHNFFQLVNFDSYQLHYANDGLLRSLYKI